MPFLLNVDTVSSRTPTTLIGDYSEFDILHRVKVSLSAGSVSAANAVCRNIDTSTRNIDTSSRNVDTSSRNVDTSSRNVDTSSRNVDTSSRNVDTSNKNCILLYLLILEDCHIKLFAYILSFVLIAYFSYLLLFVYPIVYCQSLPINGYFKGKAIPLQA
jgi:hypothetical protein